MEQWAQEAQNQGTRALEQLRGGVENAIAALRQGFIAHPVNTDLRQKIKLRTLTTLEFYQQLLRLIYRMIFLFVAEDRNLLLYKGASAKAHELYADYYSLTRISGNTFQNRKSKSVRQSRWVLIGKAPYGGASKRVGKVFKATGSAGGFFT